MDKQENKFSLISRIKSFAYAFNGLKTFFTTQHNSWIHLSAAILVIILGFIFHVNSYEWCVLIFAIGFVFVAEIFNTAIEFLSDFVSPDQHPQIGKIKDIAAGGVLISAIASAIIGLVIFVPKIVSLL